MSDHRTKLSPPELAARWGKKASTIIALIRAGELRAIDVSLGRARPRFLIDVTDIAVFEERCAVGPPPSPTPRRRCAKAEPQGFVRYF